MPSSAVRTHRLLNVFMNDTSCTCTSGSMRRVCQTPINADTRINHSPSLTKTNCACAFPCPPVRLHIWLYARMGAPCASGWSRRSTSRSKSIFVTNQISDNESPSLKIGFFSRSNSSLCRDSLYQFVEYLLRSHCASGAARPLRALAARGRRGCDHRGSCRRCGLSLARCTRATPGRGCGATSAPRQPRPWRPAPGFTAASSGGARHHGLLRTKLSHSKTFPFIECPIAQQEKQLSRPRQ